MFALAAHIGAMNVAKFKFTLVLFRPFHMVLRFKGLPSIFMEQTRDVWFSRLQQKSHSSVDNCPGPNVLNSSSAWSWHSVEGSWSSPPPHHRALTLEGRGLGINVVLPGSKVDKLGSSENQTLLHPEIYG